MTSKQPGQLWKQIIDWGKQIILLAEQTRQNSEEIAELRSELRELAKVVRSQGYALQRFTENEMHEREKKALRLENELLRFERRLPAGKQRGR